MNTHFVGEQKTVHAAAKILYIRVVLRSIQKECTLPKVEHAWPPLSTLVHTTLDHIRLTCMPLQNIFSVWILQAH